ncbi:hypothetical protein DOTSEDRAFT_39684 [Dothistroma septosporum NZE10]|uniref:Uncharacterized protein n=1 Tax=Dothistroma septosporum (strain NZE10 / CBS 128990) TaxID=675120 RepID=M2XZP9_DOTSN|nr:hypothetical protein DOTSEDRAFT_39684 [Dothistroma septosporum NZE10]
MVSAHVAISSASLSSCPQSKKIELSSIGKSSKGIGLEYPSPRRRGDGKAAARSAICIPLSPSVADTAGTAVAALSSSASSSSDAERSVRPWGGIPISLREGRYVPPPGVFRQHATDDISMGSSYTRQVLNLAWRSMSRRSNPLASEQILAFPRNPVPDIDQRSPEELLKSLHMKDRINVKINCSQNVQRGFMYLSISIAHTMAETDKVLKWFKSPLVPTKVKNAVKKSGTLTDNSRSMGIIHGVSRANETMWVHILVLYFGQYVLEQESNKSKQDSNVRPPRGRQHPLQSISRETRAEMDLDLVDGQISVALDWLLTKVQRIHNMLSQCLGYGDRYRMDTDVVDAQVVKDQQSASANRRVASAADDEPEQAIMLSDSDHDVQMNDVTSPVAHVYDSTDVTSRDLLAIGSDGHRLAFSGQAESLLMHEDARRLAKRRKATTEAKNHSARSTSIQAYAMLPFNAEVPDEADFQTDLGPMLQMIDNIENGFGPLHHTALDELQLLFQSHRCDLRSDVRGAKEDARFHALVLCSDGERESLEVAIGVEVSVGAVLGQAHSIHHEMASATNGEEDWSTDSCTAICPVLSHHRCCNRPGDGSSDLLCVFSYEDTRYTGT